MRYLRPAIRRQRGLRGLTFTRADWLQAREKGWAGFLLSIEPSTNTPELPLLRYLRYGEQLGVPLAYKCRTRSPWYAVPHVHTPDALLTYMSHGSPQLVANRAGVVAPNTFHVIRLHQAAATPAEALSALWVTSLARLSAEVEGHPLGGGLLKLEPSEAAAVVLPRLAGEGQDSLSSLASELDALIRAGRVDRAYAIADREILQAHLGLSESDCMLLRDAAVSMQSRRLHRRDIRG